MYVHIGHDNHWPGVVLWLLSHISVFLVIPVFESNYRTSLVESYDLNHVPHAVPVKPTVGGKSYLVPFANLDLIQDQCTRILIGTKDQYKLKLLQPPDL